MRNINIDNLTNISAEAGIISTLLCNSEFILHSDNLTPHHFYNSDNGYIYFAISELVKKGVSKIDSYNISMILESRKETIGQCKNITPQNLNELIEIGSVLARTTVEDYLILVENVLDMAFRRETYNKLKDCERLVFDGKEENIQSKIYSEIETIICDYQNIKPVELMKTTIDAIWNEITTAHNEDNFIDFKFPSLNKYCKISRTDCIVFAAREKRGKSIMLLNCLVDLLNKDKKVLYIDTELSTKLFTMRLIAHLTQIDFVNIRDKNYDSNEKVLIENALNWIKSKSFIHEYLPVITDDKLISLAKQTKHKYGIEVAIIDYLKGNGEFTLDAYKNSASLGKMTDTLKNLIAGREEMFVLTAVQATANGAIADSAKIIRNCSALLYLERKTNEEIASDGGLAFGNMKLMCVANRNGMLHGEGEYISLSLDGNKCTFKESKQAEKKSPF